MPFGCLGKAVLPKGIFTNDKFSSKVTHVAALGVDPLTSGGVWVLYPSAGGVLKTPPPMYMYISDPQEVVIF